MSITVSLDDVMRQGLGGGPVLMDTCRTVALSCVVAFLTTWLARSIVLISSEMGRRKREAVTSRMYADCMR